MLRRCSVPIINLIINIFIDICFVKAAAETTQSNNGNYRLPIRFDAIQNQEYFLQQPQQRENQRLSQLQRQQQQQQYVSNYQNFNNYQNTYGTFPFAGEKNLNNNAQQMEFETTHINSPLAIPSFYEQLERQRQRQHQRVPSFLMVRPIAPNGYVPEDDIFNYPKTMSAENIYNRQSQLSSSSSARNSMLPIRYRTSEAIDYRRLFERYLRKYPNRLQPKYVHLT